LVRTLALDPVIAIDGHAQVLNARIVVDPGRSDARYRHMAIHPYPVELVGSITLHDGTTLPVRPILRRTPSASERSCKDCPTIALLPFLLPASTN